MILMMAASLNPAWAPALAQDAPRPAFPGALGWAATTPGGRGGRIIKVTNLDADGPGSLRAALDAKGPRIVVFEVGGVIDLGRRSITLREPQVTIAGQTAPSPGITIIRGGIDIAANDVVMRHLRVRVGDAEQPKASGFEQDSMGTVAAHDVIVDHCSLTWATDENLSASGKRFKGAGPEEWRASTSHRVTFQHNIIAEGLANASHYKIEHSKGSLIHDNVTDILIVGNLYAHDFERSPLFKGGVHGVIVNNFIYDPGQRAIHYNLMANEWGDHPRQNGQMVVVGNVLRAGPSTILPLALVEIGGVGDLDYFGRDNVAVDKIGQSLPELGRYTTSAARIIVHDAPMIWPEGLQPLPSDQVETAVLTGAGARPWDRDADDVRLLADVAEGRGRIIDSQTDLHGYPVQKPTHRAFDPADWNLDDMEPLTPRALDSAVKAKGT